MDTPAIRLHEPTVWSAIPPAAQSSAEANRQATSDTACRCAEPTEVPVIAEGSEVSRRIMDVTFAALLLLLLLPVLALVALMVWATSPGPVIFRQVRAGRNGQFFVLRKFRTMRVDADRILDQDPELKAQFAARWKLDNDPRVTPVGRWLRKLSLDELPQLINILRGEMSIVGPRPVQPAELEEVYADCADVVFSVKPGLTGLWQVAGRSSVSYEERIALDLEYLRRRSGWFDLVVMARTIPALLRTRDAS